RVHRGQLRDVRRTRRTEHHEDGLHGLRRHRPPLIDDAHNALENNQPGRATTHVTEQELEFRIEKLEKRLNINMDMVQALGTATMNHHVAQRDVRDLLMETTQQPTTEPPYELLKAQMGRLRTARERVEQLREERYRLESEIQRQPWFDSITAADADRAAAISEAGPGPYIGDEAGITAGLLRVAQIKRNQHSMAWMFDSERL